MGGGKSANADMSPEGGREVQNEMEGESDGFGPGII